MWFVPQVWSVLVAAFSAQAHRLFQLGGFYSSAHSVLGVF